MNTTKCNIEIIYRRSSVTICGSTGDLTLSRKEPAEALVAFFSVSLSTGILDDLESTGLVSVVSCDFDQGFLFLRPLPSYDLDLFCESLAELFALYNL